MNSAIGIVIAMRERAPRASSRSALTTTSASTASRMIMIAKHRDQRGGAADRADLVARHLAERLAVAAHREEQDDHVLHGAGEDRRRR